METIQLVSSMYPCQDIPVVVFGKRCPNPCLYCGLHQYQFPDKKILATGTEKVIDEMSKYKGAYFSPVTDCFLPENSELTHYLLEETWKINPIWVPLVITKQIIPEKTIKLFIENKQKLVLQISVPSVSQDIVSILEPGSALVEDRLKLIKKLTSAGISVIAVAMPLLHLEKTDENAQELPNALSKVGIKKAIIATGVLAEKQREKLLLSGNKKIATSIGWMEMCGEESKKIYTFALGTKLIYLSRLVSIFSQFGIKTVICTSDNHDLNPNFGLPLCQQFKHHNFKI